MTHNQPDSRIPSRSHLPELNLIRTTFLDYFASHGHEILPSSDLVPADDPSLLFVIHSVHLPGTGSRPGAAN